MPAREEVEAVMESADSQNLSQTGVCELSSIHEVDVNRVAELDMEQIAA